MLSQLRCSGTLEAVQLISSSYPTRIPYADIYGRYQEHMPDFVQKLEPQYFTEAIALACDVSEDDYQVRPPRDTAKCTGWGCQLHRVGLPG